MANSGCVYVIGLMDGRVKVGATSNLKERLVVHRSTLGKESEIIGEWASRLHRNYFANEKQLIRFMGGVGEIAECNYVDVVRFASTLFFDERPADPDLTEHQMMKAKLDERSKSAKASRAERDGKILELHAQGLSGLAIANKMGLTYQRVGQIINKSKEGGK